MVDVVNKEALGAPADPYFDRFSVTTPDGAKRLFGFYFPGTTLIYILIRCACGHICVHMCVCNM